MDNVPVDDAEVAIVYDIMYAANQTQEKWEPKAIIGDVFTETAGELKDNGIDGKYFLAMLKNEDKDLTTSILLMEALASKRFN